MIELACEKKCSGCMACKVSCPRGAIRIKTDAMGFKYPQIDNAKCVQCGICTNVCPVLNKQISTNKLQLAYAVYSKNEESRKNSTSGGVFGEIANYFVERNGTVFGAEFDENYCVRHVGIHNNNDIEKLKGSKYVQSGAYEVFEDVKKKLIKGDKVLFVGTPCQVAGLSRYLKKDYENLILIDFVCYGVASPAVWKEYLNLFWANKNISKIFFKDKKYGWDRWHFLVRTKNGEEYRERGKKNIFMCGYLDGLYIRESCMNCSFKNTERYSDITIGDCWGIETINPKMNDNKGISAVLVNTEKGKKMFEEISGSLNIFEVESMERLFEHNPYFYKCAPESGKRKAFYETYENNPSKAFEIFCMGNKLKFYFDKIFISKLRKMYYILRKVRK